LLELVSFLFHLLLPVYTCYILKISTSPTFLFHLFEPFVLFSLVGLGFELRAK
jgi:hypothetical protein